MKRIACLFVVVLCSAVLLHAQDTSRGTPMAGWICDSQCVVQSGDHATCNKDCTQTAAGKAVFIDDRGNVWNVSDQSQPMCHKHMGKRVRMMASMDSEQRAIDQIHFLNEEAP